MSPGYILPYPSITNLLFLRPDLFHGSLYTELSTLQFLIVQQVSYLFFSKFSFLDALIQNYIFIKFWEKIPPTFLFHPIFLLEFDKKTVIFGKFFRISFSSAKCNELSAVPLKFETEFLK